ncbi:MAG: aminoacyl--tRNA ligase-related protein [Patescibacteria group bacterium]
MRQSQLFTRTRKDAPKDEVAKNAQLLIRAGFIHKEMAGVYSFLPLGLRVLNKISDVVREEMNAIGGQELLMTTLQSKELWEQTDRWSDSVVDNWFKTQLKTGGEVGLGFTHEEPLTRIMHAYVSSYADLPRLVYQIQWKFRNEERAKSGIMRGREFLMKDLYSFATSQKEHEELYEKVAKSYEKVFSRLGIGEKTYRTFASGGVFSKYSHEFQCVLPVGEDTIYVSAEKKLAVNKEVKNAEVLADLGLSEAELKEEKAVEVGNIFSLGTRFSEPLGLTFKDKGGEDHPVIMGSYGLGPTRLMGVLVEVFADKAGIIWPKEVAPFHVHLLAIAGGDEDIQKEADRMYEMLQENDIAVLYDDRDVRAGEKFADADLIGIPTRLVVSEKTVAAGGVEMSERKNGKGTLVAESDLIDRLHA